MRRIKLIIERHKDGYIGYPLGLKGVVVGQGDTYEEALQDVKSAIRFHVESFGKQVLGPDELVEAFVAETEVSA
jgi:predicted RNase H-like HicB family nuclease